MNYQKATSETSLKALMVSFALHLGVDPEEVIEIVRTSKNDIEQDQRLKDLFPEDLRVHQWNRKVVQMGMSEMGQRH